MFRFLCAALCGAQLFFAAVAAQAVFPKEVAALERSDPRRVLAADLVGAMLARLDVATLVLTAVAVVLAVRRRVALLPLAAGLCAVVSTLYVTPAIHAMRAAGETALPRFGMFHGVSSGLLLLEMILLAIAAWIG